ncbi:Flavinator of succinate dehydrogenase-domain-containing protein [Umbelopsis sp. PMI_123]|nr:Flavinator of succinate dehydrogenase-domain-containing protein [Umbelopsis sp. PMI_123]
MLRSTFQYAGDPFPYLQDRHSNQVQVEDPYPKLDPIPRPNESLETKRSRLVYQSRKRGILETDLLLSTFAKKFLPNFDMEQLKQYDALLDEADWDIFYYATFKKEVPEHLKSNQALQMLQEHAKNEGKVILQMPSLSM